MIPDPETIIQVLKICIIANFILAFLQWHRGNFGFAKFLAVLSLVNVLLIMGVHYYGQV